MAKYRGRDCTILGDVVKAEDNLINIQTPDGPETVKKAEVTVYDEKEVPDEMHGKNKVTKLTGYKLASKEEVAEEKRNQQLLENAKKAEAKATEGKAAEAKPVVVL